MAIRSTFYDTAPGEGVKETEWAQSALSRGPLYGVGGPNDLRLTAHPTTPYAVNIGPGKFFGHGVWDDNDSTVLVQCPTPAAGSTRWDLIAGRRDWQPAGGGPTSLRAIAGTATLAIPTGRENRPGIVDDQPVWLVQWKAGLPQPQQIIDLRCWAGPGGVEIVHKLALNYLAEPGASVKLGSSTWRYEAQANGVWDWREYPAGPFGMFTQQLPVNSAIPAGGQVGPFRHNFPPGRFTQPPIVTFGVSNPRLSPGSNNVSTTGFDLYIRNDSNAATLAGGLVSYAAVQVSSSSASG